MDVLNKVLTWVDHNRYLAMAIVLVVAVVLVQVGCKPMTTGLVSDQPVTRQQYEAEATQAQQDLVTQRAAIEKAAVDVEAMASAKAIETNAKIEQLKAQATQEVSAARAKVDQDAKAFNAAVASFQDRLSSGYKDLERQEAQNMALVKLAETTANQAVTGTITPTGLIATGVTLLGLLGLGVMGDNLRKDRHIEELKASQAPTSTVSAVTQAGT